MKSLVDTGKIKAAGSLKRAGRAEKKRRKRTGITVARLIRHFVILLLALLLPIEVVGGNLRLCGQTGCQPLYPMSPAGRHYQPLQQRKINDVPWPAPLTGSDKTSRVINPAAAHYDHHIRRAALSYNIDPLLLKAIIQTESDFNQYAVSRNGAQGLMQLMPKTARDMRVKNPFDAAQNINGGARYLKSLLNNYRGDLVRSLAAYNAGTGEDFKKRPPAENSRNHSLRQKGYPSLPTLSAEDGRIPCRQHLRPQADKNELNYRESNLQPPEHDNRGPLFSGRRSGVHAHAAADDLDGLFLLAGLCRCRRNRLD